MCDPRSHKKAEAGEDREFEELAAEPGLKHAVRVPHRRLDGVGKLDECGRCRGEGPGAGFLNQEQPEAGAAVGTVLF